MMRASGTASKNKARRLGIKRSSSCQDKRAGRRRKEEVAAAESKEGGQGMWAIDWRRQTAGREV